MDAERKPPNELTAQFVFDQLVRHCEEESGWEKQVLQKISDVHNSLTAFQNEYGPTLRMICDRTKYWNGVRDSIVRSSLLVLALGILGGVGSAVWAYVKDQIGK